MVMDMAISTRSCCAFSEDVVRKTINLSEDGAPPRKRVGERPTSATTSLRFFDMFSSPFLNPPARCCTTPAVVAFAVTFLLPKRYCDSYPACIWATFVPSIRAVVASSQQCTTNPPCISPFVLLPALLMAFLAPFHSVRRTTCAFPERYVIQFHGFHGHMPVFHVIWYTFRDLPLARLDVPNLLLILSLKNATTPILARNSLSESFRYFALQKSWMQFTLCTKSLISAAS